MKKIALLPLALMLVYCGRPDTGSHMQSDIDSICNKWVPVSSESICSATITTMSDKSVVLKGETTCPDAKKELIAYLDKMGVTYADSLVVLPDTSVGEKEWGIVTQSVCNIRGERSQAAEMINQALMGTPVKILKRDGSWYLVQTPDMYIGWAEDDAVSLRTIQEMDEWRHSKRMIYTSKWGDVANMSKDGIVSDIVFGSVVQVTGESLFGIDVVLPDGRKGSLKKTDVEDFGKWAAKTDHNADELVSFGRTFLGYPYLWGGISHKGVDCSGFARACYFSIGTILTRDASSQFLYGTEVDIISSTDALQPGDLLFFGSAKDHITHVGMYIGNTEVIHSSGMVRINSLDPTRENYSEYLRSRLQGARRFLGAPSAMGSMRVMNHKWYFQDNE